MNKQGEITTIFNSRTLVFVFGGAIFGYMLSETLQGAIIGGIVGGILSFLR